RLPDSFVSDAPCAARRRWARRNREIRHLPAALDPSHPTRIATPRGNARFLPREAKVEQLLATIPTPSTNKARLAKYKPLHAKSIFPTKPIALGKGKQWTRFV